MVKQKIIILLIINIAILFLSSTCMSWDNEKTHKDLSFQASKFSKLGTGVILENIGLKEALKEPFKLDGKTKQVIEWLQEGAKLEDAGSDRDYLKGAARSFNHFHDPLKQWTSAGLNDFYTGKSAFVWAQDQAYQEKYITLEGDQTWQASRLYFYNALTGKELTYRHDNFAKMFKVLGHQMHLIQDMAVPAHVRNDAHPSDAKIGKNYITGDLLFETYAKNRVGLINDLAANAVVPQVDLTKNPGNMVSIAWNDKKRGLI